MPGPDPPPMKQCRLEHRLALLVGLLVPQWACEGTSPELSDDDGALGGASGEPLSPPYELSECETFEPVFATDVEDFSFGEGQSFGQDKFPEIALGPPQGRGINAGSLDVVSLGHGGTVTVSFEGRVIIDGEGTDLIVFENAFEAGEGSGDLFIEPGIVAVSEDGVIWHEFPCAAEKAPWAGCAGLEPVTFDGSEGAVFEPASAGGDRFDLADLGVSEARFVRVRDAPEDDHVFDLDSIAVINGRCE